MLKNVLHEVIMAAMLVTVRDQNYTTVLVRNVRQALQARIVELKNSV